jgi:hypothetical protein
MKQSKLNKIQKLVILSTLCEQRANLLNKLLKPDLKQQRLNMLSDARRTI